MPVTRQNISGNAATANTATKLSASDNGAAPHYSARAWVNFSGPGALEIRASGNVLGITDNGFGDYTVNFANAMTDANYCAVCSDEAIVNGVAASVIGAAVYTINGVTIRSYGPGGQRNDPTYCNVTIFR